jgi:selenocysteine lyase/cysteine desulfurase
MKNLKLPKVVGTNDIITLKNGKRTRVIKLNNAATTPPFEATLKAVNEFMRTFGAYHRGAGPHATLTFDQCGAALTVIRAFLNLRDDQTMLFTTNTSAAINLFVEMLGLRKDDVVITTVIEHTSNKLPWRLKSQAQPVYVNAFNDGALDYKDLERKVKQYQGRLKVISLTGASNLTGYIPDIPRVAKLAHEHGALLFVDAAQLAPHRPLNVQGNGIDAVAFSAHKIYAPFGLGVLVLPKKMLEKEPVAPGGGSIDMINDRGEIVWAPPLVRHHIGTWNTTGLIALAASFKAINEAGWENILAHERELVHYAARKLAAVPGLTMYVPLEKYLKEDHTGAFPFNLKGHHHALVSAILENEYGIETRAGTICNHVLVRRWLKVNDAEQKAIEKEISRGNRLASYGMVRASLGIHNTKEDIDALVAALTHITEQGSAYSYVPIPEEEIYVPREKVARNI